jgi:hypothetical protein
MQEALLKTLPLSNHKGLLQHPAAKAMQAQQDLRQQAAQMHAHHLLIAKWSCARIHGHGRSGTCRYLIYSYGSLKDMGCVTCEIGSV